MSTTLGRTLAIAVIVALLPSRADAARLTDGSRLRVRLLEVITSETSTIGDSLDFVVRRDVVSDGYVLIARGTRVAGTLVDVARAKLGFFTRPGRLVFRFDRTTTRDGQVIRLRASPTRRPSDRVVVDRGGRHHLMQWADGADVFDAFVDGSYEVAAATP